MQHLGQCANLSELMRATRSAKSTFSAGLFACSVLLLTACAPASAPEDGGGSNEYERYSQQLDLTDKQLARNEKLLDKQEEIADRMLKLVERWEKQADAK
jgi:ABC-type oligopeptide transport system substrate-binding subunit